MAAAHTFVADLVVVIMAGGAGTRFWPASTAARPKQLLALTGDRTLLQMSFDRIRSIVPPERVYVVTSAAIADAVRAQLPEVARDNILAEPERKDTAAAIAWAALVIEAAVPGAVMAVLTSDHIISPTAAFTDALVRAADGARASGALYTFGIVPTYPATGFGYLQLAGTGDDERLVRFVEKPPRDVAEDFVARGTFLWNSGMFVWRVDSILVELKRSLPAHVDALAPAVRGEVPLVQAFARLHKTSIDFGVMEKARDVRCVRAVFQWSDVGSFPALKDHLPHDAANNAHNGRIVAVQAHDNVVWSNEPDELVALLGVSDLVVVRVGKRTLVAHKDRAEDLKRLVESLSDADRESS